MNVIYADQTQTFDVRGAHMTRMIAPSTGARELMLWHGSLDVGASAPAHYHDHEEAVVILAGRVRMIVGGEISTLAVGDSCLIPPQTEHQIINIGQEPCEWIGTMLVGTRFWRADGSEVFAPAWTL